MVLNNKYMNVKFKHIDLHLVEPAFDSRLTDLIIELDYAH